MITGRCVELGHGPDPWPGGKPTGVQWATRDREDGVTIRMRYGTWHYRHCDCPWPNPIHPFVLVDIDGEQVEVDEHIALLVRELNKAGARTHASCQGGRHEPGMVILLTQDAALVGEALRITARHHPIASVMFCDNAPDLFPPRTVLYFPGHGARPDQNLTTDVALDWAKPPALTTV